MSTDEEAPKDMWAAEEDMRLFCADIVDKHGAPRERQVTCARMLWAPRRPASGLARHRGCGAARGIPRHCTALMLAAHHYATSLPSALAARCRTPAPRHTPAVASERRRKWCDAPKNLAGRKLSPDHTYTFHIWQHLIDFSSYKLSVGGLVNIDLAAALNAQPLQLTCKDIKVRGAGGAKVAGGAGGPQG